MLLVPYACAATCDTIITLSLCWYLHRTPKEFPRFVWIFRWLDTFVKTLRRRAQMLINTLIVYTVNTSLWTTYVISPMLFPTIFVHSISEDYS